MGLGERGLTIIAPPNSIVLSIANFLAEAIKPCFQKLFNTLSTFTVNASGPVPLSSQNPLLIHLGVSLMSLIALSISLQAKSLPGPGP